MSFSKERFFQSFQLAILLCIASLAINGCSGAGGSGANQTQATMESEEVMIDDGSATSTAMPGMTVRVSFDITVPVYISNELQVRLVWGDKDITANWVVAQSWVISDEFPANTSHPLLVTFNDHNGGTTIGSFETTFETGSNPSETFQILAEQFDTDRWDDDNDGVSNLKENSPSAVSPSSTEALSIIFEIADGKAIVDFSDAIRALVDSTDGSTYPLVSSSPGVVVDDLWTPTSNSRTYECPLSGTVQRSEHRWEGRGLMTHLIADNCTDSEQVINGLFRYGRSWANSAETVFTVGRNASLNRNNGASELVADYTEQFLPLEFGVIGGGRGWYEGQNVSSIKNGVPIYKIGVLANSEWRFNDYNTRVREIFTSATDIDEIRSIMDLRKSDDSNYFTSGSFAVLKNDVQVLLIDADTGNENTFSLISTDGDSSTSEVLYWRDYAPLNSFPLAQ